MYVIASFEYSDRLDWAITQIEKIGIPNQQLLVLPLDQNERDVPYLDTEHHSHTDFLAYPTFFGTVLMLLGAIYGFVLAWGPILWAIFGLIAGILSGIGVDFMLKKKQRPHSKRKLLTEVIVMIQCSPDQVERIRHILLKQMAIGLTTFENERNNQ